MNYSPEIFQRKIQETLQRLKEIKVLVDDILIFGSGATTEEAMKDHNENLRKLLIRLKEKKCKLNRKKMKICQTSVKFFRHVLSDEGLKPDLSKISAIQEMPSPVDKKDVMRFLSMINYLSR